MYVFQHVKRIYPKNRILSTIHNVDNSSPAQSEINYTYSPGLRLERYDYKHDTFTLRDGTALTNNLSVLSLLI